MISRSSPDKNRHFPVNMKRVTQNFMAVVMPIHFKCYILILLLPRDAYA